jgi:hypothetical protein
MITGLLGCLAVGVSLLFIPRRGRPSKPFALRSPFVPEPGQVYQVRARALRDAETWMHDVTSEEMVRYRRARKEADPEGLRKPIQVAILRNGRLELIDGRHRTALADDDEIIPVEFRPRTEALYERTFDSPRGPSGVEYEKGAPPTPLIIKNNVVDAPKAWKPQPRSKPFPYEE